MDEELKGLPFESGASLVEVYSDGHGLNWCKGDMKLTVLVQRINYLQLIKKVMEVKSTRTLSCVSEGPIQDSKKLKGQFPSSWFISVGDESQGTIKSNETQNQQTLNRISPARSSKEKPP